jgi:hypothetical protein
LLLKEVKMLNDYPKYWKDKIFGYALDWRHYLSDNYDHNLTYRPQYPPYPKYKGLNHSRLRRSFKDAHLIDVNYSQAFQDMFVLSVFDGKRKGSYLEIGVNDTHKGSNTTLLQVDIEPAIDSFRVLQKIPWERTAFGIITFKHNDYLDCDNIRFISRQYLKQKGYELLVSDISPTYTLNSPKVSYQDWWYHPNHIKPGVVEVMKDISKGPKNPINYIYNETDGAVHTKDQEFIAVPWH